MIKEAIFAEGLRLAEEVLQSETKIFDVFFTESFAAGERGKAFLQKVETKNLAEVSEKVLESLSDTKNSQGIILIAEKPATGQKTIESVMQTDSQKLPLVILLHQINNPANLGAVLRTAAAVNVTGVILTRNSADVFSPKALRGAMGATLRLPIWTNAEFFDVLNWAREKKFNSICADVNSSKSYLKIDWKKPRLLVFGSEAHGLSRTERGEIEESLIIPMENQVESLNLAVSSGILLYEAKRQKQ